MFSYYGSKSKIIDRYPEPAYSVIVEPFCGSARYALKYWKREVHINDLDPTIYGVWKWIVGATKNDIRALPKKLEQGKRIDEYTQLSQVERDLIGFAACYGTSGPAQHAPTRWATVGSNTAYHRLVTDLIHWQGRLSHWTVTNKSWHELENIEASWYIDPPYQKQGGKHYKKSAKEIDFVALGKWCMKCRGQVIVCEGTGADWLPFRPLIKAARRTNDRNNSSYSELIYTRSDRIAPGHFNL